MFPSWKLFTMSVQDTWDWSPWCVPGKSDPHLDSVAANAPAPHTDRPDVPADCNVHVPPVVVAVRERKRLRCVDSLLGQRVAILYSPALSRAPVANVPFRCVPSAHCHLVAADPCVYAPASAQMFLWSPDSAPISAAVHCVAACIPSPAAKMQGIRKIHT